MVVSCNDDDVAIEDQVNTVKYYVSVDKDVPFTINGFHGKNLTANHEWEHYFLFQFNISAVGDYLGKQMAQMDTDIFQIEMFQAPVA
ncbi:MAG: hypothetical protein IJP70_00685 [Bacteroidales bacterium]|nr:hypothetical protein [Bacteroidales bacterium]